MKHIIDEEFSIDVCDKIARSEIKIKEERQYMINAGLDESEIQAKPLKTSKKKFASTSLLDFEDGAEFDSDNDRERYGMRIIFLLDIVIFLFQ